MLHWVNFVAIVAATLITTNLKTLIHWLPDNLNWCA